MDLKPHTIDLNNFREYESYIDEILQKYEILKGRVKSIKHFPPLFRGIGNSNRTLTTTLERTGLRDMAFDDYALKVELTRSKIETLISKRWEYKLKDLDLAKATDPIDLLPIHKNYHLYEFFVYLRHHGFPSPLLDWTMSPYVAAFFAFDSIGKEEPESGRVSIYCYIEMTEGTKSGEEGDGLIWSIGPNLVAHKRHFLQQCRYTVCLKRIDDRYVFGNHEAAIHPRNADQDIVIKMTLPFSERKEVLKKLKFMNIGPYQLFDNEDALVRDLAYETFLLT